MIKKAISVSLVGAMFVFSGCGDQEAVDRLEAQQQLDSGNYSATVAALEAKTNRTDDENMVLASAYMGQAGFSFSDTMKVLSNATSTDNNNNSNATFSNFAAEVHGKKTATTLETLEKAINAYSAIGDTNTTNAPAYKASARAATKTTTTGDKDLFLGLTYLIKATTAIDYLGDASKIGSTTQDPDLLASSCALVKVYSPSSSLPTNCSSATISNTAVVENNTTYHKIQVQVALSDSNNTYVRWANAGRNEMILTDYNSTNTTAPTPIKIAGKDVTVGNVIVDTMNNAFDKILNIAPKDVKGDITKFKTEVGTDNNGKVTAKTVADYIAKQN